MLRTGFYQILEMLEIRVNSFSCSSGVNRLRDSKRSSSLGLIKSAIYLREIVKMIQV